MFRRNAHLLWLLPLVIQLAGCQMPTQSHAAARKKEWRYLPSDSEVAAVGAAGNDAFPPAPYLVVEFCMAHGVPERAFAYFESHNDHLMLSWMYLTGTGIAKDPKKALLHWEQSVPDESNGEERTASKQRLKEMIDSRDEHSTSLEELFAIHTTPALAHCQAVSEKFRAERREKERQHWIRHLPESTQNSLAHTQKLFARYQDQDGVRVYMENQGGTIRNAAAIQAKGNSDERFHQLILTLAGYRPTRKVSPKEVQAIEKRRIEAVREKRRYYASEEFQREIRCDAADNLRHMNETEVSWEKYRDSFLESARAVTPRGMSDSEWARFLRFSLIQNRLLDLAGPWEEREADTRRL